MSETALSPRRPAWPLRMWNRLSRNPIVYKEFRSRMRQRRALWFIILPLLGAAGLVLLVSLIVLEENNTADFESRRQVGQAVFIVIIGIQATLAMLIAPAISAGALASEHEHQTYDLLRVTLLSARSLVWGKFVASAAFILLLMLLQLPLLSLTFLFGGIEPAEILVHTSVNLASVLYFCSIGILISSLNRRALPATIGAYVVSALLSIFLPLLLLLLGALFFDALDIPSSSALVQAFLMAGGLFLVSLSPPATMLVSENFLQDGDLWYTSTTLNNGTTLYAPSPWLIFLALSLLLTLLFLGLTVRRVKRKER